MVPFKEFETTEYRYEHDGICYRVYKHEEGFRWDITVNLIGLADIPGALTMKEGGAVFISAPEAYKDMRKNAPSESSLLRRYAEYKTFSVQETAKVLDVTPSRVYALINAGLVKPVDKDAKHASITYGEIKDRLENNPGPGRPW